MGHLRTGNIPKTRKWQDIVSLVSSKSDIEDIPYTEIADKTLEASNIFLRKIPYDEVLQCCFQFLVVLSIAGQSSDVDKSAREMGIHIDGDPTKINLSKSLRSWLEINNPQSSDYEIASLARQATADTIASWINQNSFQEQLTFFEEKDPFKPWRTASTGKGFCKLTQCFFANFTTRYLNYFLSRTANSNIKTLDERARFNDAVKQQSEIIAQHTFETSKLVVQFAAGWFNKHAASGAVPSYKEIQGFLIHSFEKLREEFRIQKEGY